MADTFSLRFEIDASRAEAGAKKFVSAISSINKGLDNLDAKAEAAFSKLMAGGASGGDFTKLAKDLGKLNNININPAAVKSINSIGNAFKNLKAPSAASLKNINTFATSIPALLNSFNVSGNFAESVNKISASLAGFKVPGASKIDALKTFGTSLSEVAPLLRISGNFAGITKLGDALGGFRAPSEKAVSNMKAFFSALNNSGAKATVSAGLVNGIINLSTAVGGMKAPSSTSVKNLRDLFSALSTFKPISGTSSITAITQAFSNFKGPTPAQIKNVESFVKMLGNLKVPTNAPQIAAYIEKIGMAAGTANKFLNNFRSNLGNIGGGKFGSQVSGMTTNLRGLENAFSGTFQAASVFRTLIGSITLGTLSKSIYDVNTSFTAFKSTLLAVNEGNLQATGEEMRYTEDMAKRLGQRIDDIQESFGSFSVSSKLAGVSTEQTRQIFEATITAMTVLHRSSDRTKLALLALEQMMSKGNVSSEELRRQLGEQLPGSVNLMARALGKTTAELNEMLKKGEVLSSEALPKFAAEIQKTYGGSLEFALKGAVAQFNLLYDAVYDLQVVVGQSGAMEALAGAFAKVREAISAPEFLSFASQFGERTGKAIDALGSVIVFLIKNIDLVIFGLKAVLAINIARYFQSFAVSALEAIVKMQGFSSGIGALISAFSNFSAVANSASLAARTFGLAASLAGALSGPIGIVIGLLGTLGIAWYTSSEKGKEFTATVDMSTESLDRYKDSVAMYTGAQIITEQQKIKQAMLDSQKASDDAASAVQKVISSQGRAGGGAEFNGIVKQFRDLQTVIKETGGNMDAFAMQLANTTWKSAAAQQLADAIINYNSAVEIAGKESEYAKAKLAILQATFDGMNAGNAVSQINAVATAANGMASAVASAAARANSAIAELNRSKAAAKFSQDFEAAESSYKDTVKAINTSSSDPATKIQTLAQASQKYKQTIDGINVSVKALERAQTQNDASEKIKKDLEEYGDAADTSSKKINDLRDRIASINKSTMGTADSRSNAIANLQEQLKEAEKTAANKGKGKPKVDHTGGAASSYLDDATKKTVQYNKAQEALEKMLKKGQMTQSEYNTALEKLKAQYGDVGAGTSQFQSDFEKLRGELMPSTTALDEFTRKKQILDQEFANTGNLQEYTELLTRLKKQYSEAATGNSSPWIAGINKGLTDLTKTSEDFTNDVAGAVSNAFGGLEDALTSWVTTGKFDFKSLTESILGDIARIVIRYTVIQPIIQALSGIMGGLFGGGSSSFTPTTTFGQFIGAVNAKGNVFNSGNVIPFAKGGLTNGSNNGIVSSPTMFEMSGNKTGLMGEAGPEAIIPLKRAADGSLGVQASGAVQASSSAVYVQPKVNINIVNNGTNANATTSTKQNSDGSLDINVLLEQIKDGVAKDISKGGTGLNKAIESRYGSSAAAGNKR